MWNCQIVASGHGRPLFVPGDLREEKTISRPSRYSTDRLLAAWQR